MSSRRDDIDEELRQLKNLERLITDQKTLDGLKVLIADLEEEKAELGSGRPFSLQPRRLGQRADRPEPKA
jgi:hypothetical protein